MNAERSTALARDQGPGAPGRSSAEIRNDLERTREELSTSVDQLRLKVGELTDWRRQVAAHREKLIVGAAVVGFAVGVRLVMRRRRSD